MARPQVDVDATKSKLLGICEDMIRERGAVSFTMTDIAQAAGMSQSNVYRFFENKDELAEAMAGRWFAELNVAMETIIASDLPAHDKMFAFFADRLDLQRQRYEDDPAMFEAYVELGTEHLEVVRGYVDLADHYMAIIIAQAMEEGYFKGLEIDETLSLINLMVQPFCSPEVMVTMMHTADRTRLATVIDTIFAGLQKPQTPLADNDRAKHPMPKMKIAG